jgi:hypothetical protein
MEFGQQRRIHWLASVQLSDAVAAAAVVAAAVAATAVATISAVVTASGSSVRRQRRAHIHRGCDLLLECHVAHRNRRRGAWLHALLVGLPHADRLFLGSRH